jgi:hypothetical protein
VPLRCKQGDLALVIAGEHNVGMVVHCLEPLPAGFWRDDIPWELRQRGARQQIAPEAGPLWRVDRPIQWGTTQGNLKHGVSTVMYVVPDKALMPISPPDETTETGARKRTPEPAQC